MPPANPELIAESLVLVLYTLVAAALTIGGLVVEYTALLKTPYGGGIRAFH